MKCANFIGAALDLSLIHIFLNMFGVPMKPPAIALLLLMGLSPINTLTLMLVLSLIHI